MNNDINPQLFNALFEPYIAAIVKKEVAEQTKQLKAELAAAKEIEKPLTITQLAEILGLSKSYLYTLCSRDEIPYEKKCSRVFFYLSKINEWLKSQ